MKKTRECCKECGRSIARYARQIDRQHVRSLWEVYKWCKVKGVHEFKLSEVKHLFGQQGYTKFAYLVHGGGMVYRHSQADYGLHMDRVQEFFANKLAIPTKIWKSPLKDVDPILDEYRVLHEIPDIKQFLDDKGLYQVEYHPQPIIEI